MKKVGIISFYYKNRNIGGLLQAYAVQKLIAEYGLEAEQICYDNSVNNDASLAYAKARKSSLVKSSDIQTLLRKGKRYIKRVLKIKSIDKELQTATRVQNVLFDEFASVIPHSSKIYNINNIHETESIYDIFLCGSDQVWNTGFLAHSAYYLSFTSKPKIAFAVSMGKAKINKTEKEYLLKQIGSFDAISVREETLKELIESISDISCTRVLDPTLLISPQEWKRIENDSSLPKGKYIFCYFLGDCTWQRKEVTRFAKESELDILDIPYITGERRKSDKYLSGTHSYNIGPREFIAAIENAEYVFTDSFHAVVFSLLFNKQFYVFDRDGQSGSASLNSRIIGLLDMVGCADRRIVSTSINSQLIDYKSVNRKLEEEITKSKDWLDKQLCKNKEED